MITTRAPDGANNNISRVGHIFQGLGIIRTLNATEDGSLETVAVLEQKKLGADRK